MRSPVRKDAASKLKGTCRFVDDYQLKGLLHGYILYSRIPCGKILNIKYPSDFDLSEFQIVKADDIPGENIVPEPVNDQPFMTQNNISHQGQIILGVAHENKHTLLAFLSGIEIEYERKEAVTDMHECLDDENLRFGDIMPVNLNDKKDIKYDSNEVYYTQHQEQAYLETQGMIAEYKNGKMFITGTMQCPFFVKSAVESIMGDSVDDVIVSTSEGIGGAFGGKEDFPNVLAGITALLSYKSQKPVKLVLDRSDDIFITTNRHPSRVAIKSCFDPENKKITAMDIDFRLDAGAYQTLSPVVLHRGILHATGGYNIPGAVIKGSLHQSNTPPNGAFRGFGCPQALFAIESHINDIAYKHNIPVVELIESNILKDNDHFPTSQILKNCSLSECLDRVLESSDYHNKLREFQEYNKSHEDKKGIGISLGLHGAGYTGNGEKVLKSEVKLKIEKDKSVKIYVANVEMGQGAHTTLAQMVADAFKLELEKVKVIIPNTSLTPNSGPTVASRTIYIVGNLLKKLALKILSEHDAKDLSMMLQNKSDEFPREYFLTFTPDPADDFDEKTNQGVAYHDYSWAACVVEISYDPVEYIVNVQKCWNVLDVGRIINHEIALGQVYGGVTQAIGWALTENIYKKGFERIDALTNYTLPSSYDTPDIHVEFINTNTSTAKGLGEIPMDYPAPAVRNAFLMATGIMINELPLSPENIYKHIEEKK